MKRNRIFTPGPTKIKTKVLKELSKSVLSPDLDDSFIDFYSGLGKKIQNITSSGNEVIILAGEGMLALDAALANLITPQDNLLILDNGIFGRGFKDLAAAYTDKYEVKSFSYQRGIDVNELETFLKANPQKFTIATLVDVDTPTGVKNDIAMITKLLKDFGIMCIVDAVAAIGGEEMALENVDLLLGASQKVISAPTGVSFLMLSSEAQKKIANRKEAIPFYLDLRLFFNYRQTRLLPYTMPRELLNAFSKSLDELVNIRTHKLFAEATRKTLVEGGIELFLEQDYANTVTAFYPPNGFDVPTLLKALENRRIYLGNSYGEFHDQLLRIGHMGNNCQKREFYYLFKELGNLIGIKKLGKKFLSNYDFFEKELCQ